MNPQDDLLWQRMRARQDVAFHKYEVIFNSRISDQDYTVKTALLDYLAEIQCAWHDYLAAKSAEQKTPSCQQVMELPMREVAHA